MGAADLLARGHNEGMPQITFSLSNYDGPAAINGVDFARVQLREHADSHGDDVLKGWNGEAGVAKSAAPGIDPNWASSDSPVEVRIDSGGTGAAYITGMALVDGRFWELELVGVGPSPMD